MNVLPNPLQQERDCSSCFILCLCIVMVLGTTPLTHLGADEPRAGLGSNSSTSLPPGARQAGNVGRTPKPSLQGVSNERLVQVNARMEAERSVQNQRINAAYDQLQTARSQGAGGYDSPEQARLIDEYNRAIRLRDARNAVSQEMKVRQITPDGKWNLPHPTRNPPPRDVSRSRGIPGTSASSTGQANTPRGSAGGGQSVALPGANAARGRSDTIAEGRSTGSSSDNSRSGSSPRAANSDATAANGTKPPSRGDATLDTRNARNSTSDSSRTSRGPSVPNSDPSSRSTSSDTGRPIAGETPSNSRIGQTGSASEGTYGRASSPAPLNAEISGRSLLQNARDAQGRVTGAVPVIVGADLAARVINRMEDVAEGREVSSTAEFVAGTAGGLAAGAVVGTAVGMAGAAAGAVIGGAVGFVLGGGPPGATAGVIAGAEIGGGAAVGMMTAIGAIRSGEGLYNALDRAFFNGDNPILNQDELLRTGLGDVPQTGQVAAGPLSGPAQGELTPGAQSPMLDQVQTQLLSQFPELANASPEEQREIALQVLGLSNQERDQVMTPQTADVLESRPPVEEIPLHPPLEIGGPGDSADDDTVSVSNATDELDSLLDSINGPREGFQGSALEDFMDQLGTDPVSADPNAVISALEQGFDDYEDQFLHDLLGNSGETGDMQGAGDETDFADNSVLSPLIYAPTDTGGDIDVSMFRSAQERDDLRNLFRTDGDYDEAMRLETALQRAEAAYRRAIEEARRLAAARRAAEAAERQRQAQIAYNNWVRQYQAWQRWTAQQQAYRNWVARQQNVSHYATPQRSAGHQSGGMILDPPQ
jgi:hypothetical protein